MILDKKFENLFLNVSCRAALSVYQFIGKENKIAADKAAVVKNTATRAVIYFIMLFFSLI